MAQETNIEWTDVTWNKVHGCSKVSPGCAHCYAEALSRRYGQTRKPWTPANAAENVILKPHKLDEPLRNTKAWRGLGAAAAAAGKTKGKLVFVNSTSDLFHELVPFEFIAAAFGVMAAAPQHTFQILTKRPERMLEFFAWHASQVAARDLAWEKWRVCEDAAVELVPHLTSAGMLSAWPLSNVWLGVSIENRRYVNRADLLRETPAAVRFISAEPLLGPLVHDRFGLVSPGIPVPTWNDGYDGPGLNLIGIDWLIVGGESGPKHRPIDEDWVRDLRDATTHTWLFDSFTPRRTAFFLKQMGGARPGDRLEDLPEDLRIREFPRV